MSDTAQTIVSGGKPLVLSLLALVINDLNAVLGAISIALSIAYTGYKFYKDLKKKK
jgi:4-hydroxybenzoate polyprenyltransferase